MNEDFLPCSTCGEKPIPYIEGSIRYKCKCILQQVYCVNPSMIMFANKLPDKMLPMAIKIWNLAQNRYKEIVESSTQPPSDNQLEPSDA